MNALVTRLLLSTGAYDDFEAMLKTHGLKIRELKLGQVKTAKLSSLNIPMADTDDEDKIYVPVHAYFSVTLEMINKHQEDCNPRIYTDSQLRKKRRSAAAAATNPSR